MVRAKGETPPVTHIIYIYIYIYTTERERDIVSEYSGRMISIYLYILSLSLSLSLSVPPHGVLSEPLSWKLPASFYDPLVMFLLLVSVLSLPPCPFRSRVLVTTTWNVCFGVTVYQVRSFEAGK